MAFEWPVDKLSCINAALTQCHENEVEAVDNGSEEWLVCSPAYERALGLLMERGNWGFATKVRQLEADPQPPSDKWWDTAFILPQDLVHIIWVKLNTSMAANLPQAAPYDIIENRIVMNAQGGPPPPATPVTPFAATIKYVSRDLSDQAQATPSFVVALQSYIMSAIYRGLKEDDAEADKLFQFAEGFAQQARTLYAQQKPKRQLWNSRYAASRRIRRPWFPTGNGGWGGNGGLPN